MKKQLDVDRVRNELQGGSAFFPGYKGGNSPAAPAVADPAPRAEPVRSPQEPEHPIPERPNAPTPVRNTAKRIITRNSFEIYEDQMDSLRRLSYRDKMEGRLGSMSAMVREAIDTYLKEKTTHEK